MANVLYGPPIRDAIAKGDLAHMKRLAEEARETLAQRDEIAEALRELEKAIQKLESSNR
jgi:Domain of unknown function (DUF1843)